MSQAAIPIAKLRLIYEMCEQNYLRALPPEHFMEAWDHQYQRALTIESFALIHKERPDIQFFNEILVQYPFGPDEFKPGQVVPDNFVAVYHEPLDVDGSFNTPLQPVAPFLVMEYVSRHNKRKDYEDNYRRYERELKVPYYLLFYPHKLDLAVFRMVDDSYVAVRPNDSGRLAIPELELEVALIDDWVRFWFRGELVPLPGELLDKYKRTQNQLLIEKDQHAASKDRLATTEGRLATVERELLAERKAREEAAELIARLQAELKKATGEGS